MMFSTFKTHMKTHKKRIHAYTQDTQDTQKSIFRKHFFITVYSYHVL
jgi:hypothetical protein